MAFPNNPTGIYGKFACLPVAVGPAAVRGKRE